MGKPIIGILTWRNGTTFQEPVYLRALVREGQKLGATVYVFSHNDVLNDKEVRGLTPSDNGAGWEFAVYPRPHAVIDRCRNMKVDARGFRERNPFTFVNSIFTNKWNATKLFAEEQSVKQWIPQTKTYTPNRLAQMFREYSILYVKPGNGTGGRSVVKLTKKTGGYEMLGRTRGQGKTKEHFATLSSLTRRINDWVDKEKMRDGTFMIQQGLDLELLPQRAVDMRLLIQKNERGVWDVTGQGFRIGGRNSATSNLHGGGKAMTAESMLLKKFGAKRKETILSECHDLAHEIANTVEKHFGRMMELGLDIGIDVNGRVWLIEVNPKPGRDIFKKMGNMKLYLKSVQRPLQFAMYVIKREKEDHRVMQKV